MAGACWEHLEVGVKHNETSHVTELLAPSDLVGAVVTADALHTVRANLDWLVTDKKAHYIAVVKPPRAARGGNAGSQAIALRCGRLSRR
jgi:hypothetical protein